MLTIHFAIAAAIASAVAGAIAAIPTDRVTVEIAIVLEGQWIVILHRIAVATITPVLLWPNVSSTIVYGGRYLMVIVAVSGV